MKYHKLRSRSFAILVTIAAVAGLVPAHLEAQSGFSGDIVCLSTRKPFLLPGVCESTCPAHANLANLNALNYGGVNGATFCDLKPGTPAIAKDDRIRQFYDLAVWNKILGGHPIPQYPPKLVLVAHILNNYYTPYKASTFTIGFGASAEQWAGLTPSSSPGTKPALMVNEDLFWLTPAFVLSVIGREMVHMEQFQRRYKTSTIGIHTAVAALRELEASSWELRKDKFPRSFKVTTPLVPYMQEPEQKEEEINYACDQWEVSKAVEDVMTGPRREVYGQMLTSWLPQDPWVRQVWLPQNPGWATHQAGHRPQVCKASNPSNQASGLTRRVGIAPASVSAAWR